uniref:APH domain-containing protein n=1 Tax=Heterorhabditis bacteriophora TaxID=37862 RepID=A0A1I7XK65_HETBA
MNIKAVLFDLGGVLIPPPMVYWNRVETEYSLPLGSILDTLLTTDAIHHFASLEKGQITAEDFEPLFTYYYNQKVNKEYRNNRTGSIIPIMHGFIKEVEDLPIFEELDKILKTLRASGLRTALITNNFYADRARRLPTIPRSVPKYFDLVIESCRSGLRKPDAEIFQLACMKLQACFKRQMIDSVSSPSQLAADLGSIFDMNFDYPPDTRECTEREKLPEDVLQHVFFKELGIEKSNMIIRKFSNGQSNPTYYIRCGEKELVLRKQPSGHLLPKAHQLDREFKIMKALYGIFPVPRVLFYNDSF